MRAGASFGVLLALMGTLVLTPDAMLMRLSGMDGFQMTGWRGLFMGTMMVLAWAVTSRDRRADLARIATGPGALIVGAQVLNSMLFCLGIATAPAAVVLMGVAAVPVFAALLSRFVTGEATSALTWAAIAAVLTGIGIAVLGGGHGEVALNWRSVLGAAFGLGVGFVLALNFVTLRAKPDLPILLAIGVGAWIAGLIGWIVTGPDAMGEGRVWAMAITGGIVLPVSFFALSLAARHTLAANVSLVMLLETVLGPLWVWVGVGERPTPAMVVGGAVVVGSLAVYLSIMRRRALKPAR